MSQLRKRNECNHFGHQKCPHIEDKIMIQATQFIPELTLGYNMPTLTVPLDEEVDRICVNCGMFTLKRSEK
jgi:hypothetical protein